MLSIEEEYTTTSSLTRFWCQCWCVASLHLGFARQLLVDFTGGDQSPSGPQSQAKRRKAATKHMQLHICRAVKHQSTLRVLGSSLGTCALRKERFLSSTVKWIKGKHVIRAAYGSALFSLHDRCCVPCSTWLPCESTLKKPTKSIKQHPHSTGWIDLRCCCRAASACSGRRCPHRVAAAAAKRLWFTRPRASGAAAAPATAWRPAHRQLSPGWHDGATAAAAAPAVFSARRCSSAPAT